MASALLSAFMVVFCRPLGKTGSLLHAPICTASKCQSDWACPAAGAGKSRIPIGCTTRGIFAVRVNGPVTIYARFSGAGICAAGGAIIGESSIQNIEEALPAQRIIVSVLFTVRSLRPCGAGTCSRYNSVRAVIIVDPLYSRIGAFRIRQQHIEEQEYCDNRSRKTFHCESPFVLSVVMLNGKFMLSGNGKAFWNPIRIVRGFNSDDPTICKQVSCYA